jgi:hypothetical protein
LKVAHYLPLLAVVVVVVVVVDVAAVPEQQILPDSWPSSSSLWRRCASRDPNSEGCYTSSFRASTAAAFWQQQLASSSFFSLLFFSSSRQPLSSQAANTITLD